MAVGRFRVADTLIKPPKTKRMKLANEIINLSIGEDACKGSRVRLASKYSEKQLEEILRLLESFQ